MKALAWLRNLIKNKNDFDTLMDKTKEKLWPDEPKNGRESLITYYYDGNFWHFGF